MNRQGNLYSQIPMWDNLCVAFLKAAKGKQDRPEVVAFRRQFAANLGKLQAGLMTITPDIGHYRFFMVHDPKPRQICAASFPERVLHHAVMNVCEPALESYAVFDSYACRKGKGQRKALARAQRFCRAEPWYLKLDIRKYFDSIDQDIAIRQLCRRFKDNDLIFLFQRLLDTYHTAPGKGVPIGNLISQHLANFYLGPMDRWIKETRKVRRYLRYMDDFVLFGPDRPYLLAELDAIRKFLDRELALTLKENVQVNRCRYGIPFLGYRVFPEKILLSPQSKNRFVRKFIRYQKWWDEGRWTDAELVRHMEPLIDFTMAADAGGFRESVIDRFGIPYG